MARVRGSFLVNVVINVCSGNKFCAQLCFAMIADMASIIPLHNGTISYWHYDGTCTKLVHVSIGCNSRVICW